MALLEPNLKAAKLTVLFGDCSCEDQLPPGFGEFAARRTRTNLPYGGFRLQSKEITRSSKQSQWILRSYRIERIPAGYVTRTTFSQRAD